MKKAYIFKVTGQFPCKMVNDTEGYDEDTQVVVAVSAERAIEHYLQWKASPGPIAILKVERGQEVLIDPELVSSA